MDVFLCLAEHANEIVTREQLLDAAWSENAGSDEQLTRAIGELRRVFHDHPGNPEYIETAPKRGYRLIGEVRLTESGEVDKNGTRSESITHFTGRNLGLITLVLVILVLAYTAFDKFVIGPAPEAALIADRSIAVLPFVNMSDDPGNEYFSDGLSEEIINLLTRVPGLKVIGRTSSFAFKGKNEDLRVIGQMLGVKTLLEGSVRKEGDRVRVAVQLVDTSDGTHIWSDTYDRTLTDIFAVQEDVASAVIGALEIHVGSAPHRGRPTDNWEAYTSFLKARLAANRLDWREALALLENAIQLDPQFAEAHELIAFSYWHMSSNMIDGAVAQPKAYEAASTAIDINPDLIFAQLIYRSRNVGSSAKNPYTDANEWAYRQQPNDPRVLKSMGYMLAYSGYKKEALRVFRRYAEVEPLSLDANLDLFAALYSDGRVEESKQVLDFINQLEASPSYWLWTIAGTRLAEGDDQSATEYFEALLHEHGYSDSDWVRELVTAARDPISGQAYLDRRIPEIAATLSENDGFKWQAGLISWYLYLGFTDRYFELINGANAVGGTWSDADEHLLNGHVFNRMGFTAHPDYIQFATDVGIVDTWDQRGPPDFCRKSGDSWACD